MLAEMVHISFMQPQKWLVLYLLTWSDSRSRVVMYLTRRKIIEITIRYGEGQLMTLTEPCDSTEAASVQLDRPVFPYSYNISEAIAVKDGEREEPGNDLHDSRNSPPYTIRSTMGTAVLLDDVVTYSRYPITGTDFYCTGTYGHSRRSALSAVRTAGCETFRPDKNAQQKQTKA